MPRPNIPHPRRHPPDDTAQSLRHEARRQRLLQFEAGIVERQKVVRARIVYARERLGELRMERARRGSR